MVCLNDKIYLSQKQLTGVGFRNPHATKGCNIDVTFYKKGDKMFNDVECTSDETIVKDFSLESAIQDVTFGKAANAASLAGVALQVAAN